jgi:hypothetical protein
MSFLFKIPKYPLLSLLSSWFAANEIGNIDIAFCNEIQRPFLLDLLSNVGFSSKNIVNKRKPNNNFKCFVGWLNLRRIQPENFHLDIDRKTKKIDLLLFKDVLTINNSKLRHLNVNFYLRNSLEQSSKFEVDEAFTFSNSDVEKIFLTLINSCGHLKALDLSNVCDDTLLKVDFAIWSGLTSLVLRDQFLEKHFDCAVNKNIRFLLTTKTMNFLNQVCRSLTHLHLECESSADSYSSAIWKIHYDYEDMARLIRRNPGLTHIHLGLKDDMMSYTDPVITMAIAETCTHLRVLTVLDSGNTNLIHLANIIVCNPQMARLKLHEPNYELEKEMTYNHTPKKDRLPDYMQEYIAGDKCRAVCINHLGTTGRPGGLYFVEPGETPPEMKDVHKLYTFFSRVRDLHQIILSSLCFKSSSIDNDVEWSSDVTDTELRLIAKNNPALTDLQLNGCGEIFTPDVFHTIFLLCPALRHLDIGSADHLTCSDLLSIFSVPNALHRAYITGHSTFTLECALQIAAECPCLVFLGVERCILPEEGETQVQGRCVVKVSEKRKKYTIEDWYNGK